MARSQIVDTAHAAVRHASTATSGPRAIVAKAPWMPEQLTDRVLRSRFGSLSVSRPGSGMRFAMITSVSGRFQAG
ncbi:hypothetical protein ABIA32_003237 [Streptacidiphilus sp. MAP12-20]